MCGILLHARSLKENRPTSWHALTRAIDERGPDASANRVLRCGECELDLHSSVLGLRGRSEATPQPVVSSDGQLLLCWNGEVFDWLEEEGQSLEQGENDALWLLAMLERRRETGMSTQEALVEVLGRIEGPYAVLLIDIGTGCIVYGRDPLGRRSLLTSKSQGGILISSVSGQGSRYETFEEIDCASLWTIDLAHGDLQPTPLTRSQTVWTRRLQLAELDEPPQASSSSSCDNDVTGLLRVLSDSVRRRVTFIRSPPSADEATPHVAVLFSGGLDCSVVAVLAHHHLAPEQPIDLLNVAFENPRVLSGKQNPDGDPYAVPDRKTGLATYQELRKVAPGRQWNFVQINVEHKDYMRQLDKITSLMAPSDSVMDLSIGAALYFSSRRTGILTDGKPYQSPARVLLSGLGADELLGGYSRHRKAYRNFGQQGLVEELQMDLDRLPTRNLGRDDRVLSSASIEARYPYLARPVLRFLCSLPVSSKMNLDLPEGQGDKILLRDAARRLGLVECAGEKKRAIQFGARSAKMQAGQGGVKGHEKLLLSSSPQR